MKSEVLSRRNVLNGMIVYLILEYVEKGELYTHLQAAKVFPEPVAAGYIGQLSRALSYLHSKVHPRSKQCRM